MDNIKFRKTHLYQMLSYIDDRDRSGWYYGNKAQFEKRQDEIIEFLEDKLEEFEK